MNEKIRHAVRSCREGFINEVIDSIENSEKRELSSEEMDSVAKSIEAALNEAYAV